MCPWRWALSLTEATLGVWFDYYVLYYAVAAVAYRQTAPEMMQMLFGQCFNEQGRFIRGAWLRQVAIWLIVVTLSKALVLFFMAVEAVQFQVLSHAFLEPLVLADHSYSLMRGTPFIVVPLQFYLVDEVFVLVRRYAVAKTASAASLVNTQQSNGLKPLLAEDHEGRRAGISDLAAKVEAAQEAIEAVCAERFAVAKELAQAREQIAANHAELQSLHYKTEAVMQGRPEAASGATYDGTAVQETVPQTLSPNAPFAVFAPATEQEIEGQGLPWRAYSQPSSSQGRRDGDFAEGVDDSCVVTDSV